MTQALNTHPPRPRQGHSAPRIAATGNWWLLAECRSADPDLFFPISSAGPSVAQADAAKVVCARCVIKSDCLSFALRTGQAHGIWGGLTEEERRQVAG